jgi:ribonuclease HII
MILGIDEVGRGPWAGPLVVGAVVLGGVIIDGLTDSKKLTKKQRERLDIEIREKAAGFGLGWVEASEIDEIGLSAALKLATRRAVEQITVPYHEIVIDGTVNFLSETNKGQYVTTMKKADLLVPSVSAASIVAKVARDNFMTLQDDIYPGYGFKKHVGYGTAFHIAAIDKLGVTPLHRLSFAPLHKFASTETIPIAINRKITTKVIGDTAEDIASEYLARVGHQILDRNWKTKFCEIDIVSQLSDVIYFTEVKYRKKFDQGGGLAAITPKKLRQMKFAAEFYVLSNQISDVNLRLAVMALSGEPPNVETFLEVQ